MKKYADRGFIEAGGVQLTDLTSATLTRSQSLQRVSTMTRNRRDAGYNNGNMTVQVTGELAIDRKKAQIDLALADEDTNVKIVFICGGERFTCLGVAESDMSISTSVGSASKSFTWEVLDVVNENGESVNVDIQLG